MISTGRMYINHRKEQFSLAFIHAVASVAGFSTSIRRVDDDSIDIGLEGNRTVGTRRRAPRLEIQAKCTETDDGQENVLSYPLPIKNYDDLRDEDVHVPRILVVVGVPSAIDQCFHETPSETAMRRCAFWTSLRCLPPVDNTTTKTVTIPREQRFTVEALQGIMTRIGDGGYP